MAATAAPQLDYLRRIFKDPSAYIEALLWIRNKRGEVVRFRMNDVQRRLMKTRADLVARGKRLRLLILKSRRMGLTTLEQALNFQLVATRPNKQTLTLAHNSESTEKIFRISNMFFDRLDPMFRPQRMTKHNKRDLNFPMFNSLAYIGTAGSYGIGRGDTLQRVHWSEVAWTKAGSIDEQRNILAGLNEACSEGEVVLETTPNGVGDLFHSLWVDASTNPDAEWVPVFIPWWEDRTYRLPLDTDQERETIRSMSDEEKDLVAMHALDAGQLAWRRSKIKEIGKASFMQEYPEDPTTCFLTSGTRFFDPMIIDAISKRAPEPIEKRDGDHIRIFKKADAKRRYTAGCDVAEGVPGGDFSVCGILDAESMEQVAVLRGHWKPEDFAHRSAKICMEYAKAKMAVERNNHGHSMLNTLANVIHYPNLYFHRDYDQKSGKETPVLGHPTDSKTRPIMLDDLRAAIEDGHMRVYDKIFCAECNTFQADRNGKYQAREGCFDDSVLAWAIALQARKRLGDKASIPKGTPTIVTPQRVFPSPARRFF